MIKSELIQQVADKNLHLHRRAIKKGVSAVLEEILTALVRRDRVELRGFGAFTVKVRSARPGRNPKTGSVVSAPTMLRSGRDEKCAVVSIRILFGKRVLLCSVR